MIVSRSRVKFLKCESLISASLAGRYSSSRTPVIPSDAQTVAKTRAAANAQLSGDGGDGSCGDCRNNSPAVSNRSFAQSGRVLRIRPDQTDRPERQRETTEEDGRNWHGALQSWSPIHDDRRVYR